MLMRIPKLSMTVVLVCGLAGLGMGTPARGETLTVAAAQSLRAPFQEILRMFEQEYGVPVEVRYGPSHTLRRQIEQGAPIDVFLSESLQEVETLHQKGLTLLGRPRQYAQTSMVVVMSSASQPRRSHSVRRRPWSLAGSPRRSQSVDCRSDGCEGAQTD